MLLFVVVINNVLWAQTLPIKNLVFEGAGLRGLAYVGAYKQLVALHKMDAVEKVGGTSAGAIIALAISLGYTAREVEAIILQLRIQEFNDGKFFMFGGLHRIHKLYGYYKGNAFLKWITKIIEMKTKNGNCTFMQLSEMGFKDLYVVGTSLSHQKSIVFSKNSFPNMRVCDAVRISMSVPLYFEPVLIDTQGKTYKNKSACNNCQLMIDGGVMQNFPIHIFDSTYMQDGLPRFIANPNTLGLRIDANAQVLQDAKDKKLVLQKIEKLQDYFTAFYTLELELASRNILSDADWARTISIPDEGFSPKVKKISVAQKNILIASGENAVKKYFEKWK